MRLDRDGQSRAGQLRLVDGVAGEPVAAVGGDVELLTAAVGRFGAAGLLVVAFDADGRLSFMDSGAPAYFGKLLGPVLEREGRAGLERLCRPACGLVSAPVGLLPGMLARGQEYSLVLVARGAGGEAGVKATCQLAGVEATWIWPLAESLPVYGSDALARQCKVLESAIRDQAEVVGLQAKVATLSGQLSTTYGELSLMHQLSSGVRVNGRAAEFFQLACSNVRRLLDCAVVGVTLSAESDGGADQGADGGAQTFVFGSAVPSEAVADQVGRCLMEVVRDCGSGVLTNDTAMDGRLAVVQAVARQVVAVPIRRQEEVAGCMFALNSRGGAFTPAEMKLLTRIAEESAVYLENAMLFQDVSSLLMGVLHAMTAAIDAKDSYTRGHSLRVARLAQLLGQQVSLDAAGGQRLYIAGLLHDVGKIGIPESILHKAGRLSQEEFEVMKRHPTIGARILADIRQVQDILPAVLHHHERYDGRGYPDGLAGTDIPLNARIIGLVDALDAMTSDRVYRRGLPLQVALSEIRRCAGTHFDPRLCEALLAAREGVEAILYPETAAVIRPVRVAA